MAFIDRYNGNYAQLITDIIGQIVSTSEVSRTRIELYLGDATVTSVEGGVINIYQKSKFKYDRLKEDLWNQLCEAAKSIGGGDCSVNLYTGSITEADITPTSASNEKDEILKSNPIEKVVQGKDVSDMSDKDISIPLGTNNYTF